MNTTSYLMGIDTGTTYTKVGVYDPSGNEVISKKAPTPLISRASGEAEFNPHSIWEHLTRLIQRIPAQVLDEVEAVSISSFAETVYPLDSKDNPLDNGIAWFDRRTLPQNERVTNVLGIIPIRRITGLFPAWIYSLNKILWFRENEVELYQKTRKWLDNAGYIIFRLSGEKIIDYSLACRTMMFDVWQRTWSQKILDTFDVDIGTLPEPVPSGMVVGQVSKRVAVETGLREGTLVVSGGMDHFCAALSVGAVEEGRILDSTGTTECILLGLNKEKEKEIDERAIKEGFLFANHVAKDTFSLFQGIYCGGFLIDWFLNKVLKDTDYHVLDKIRYGLDAPLFIPYLRGSDFGVMSGALFGLRDFHNRDSILCSITETIAFEFKKMVDGLETIINKDTSGWVARSVGGGARSDLLLKYKANLLNKSVEVPINREATCQGAALLAGIGSRVYEDEHQAVKETFKVSRVFTPEPSEVEKSQIRYQKYCKALLKYKEIQKELI